MKFGIIGYGRFGKLWASALQKFGEVFIYDKEIKSATLQEVAQADVLFILVPISEFESVCQEIKPFLAKNTLVIDCCSVKKYPAAIMQQVFSDHQSIIATHPLFGPDSVKRSGGIQGHKIVVCPLSCDANKLNELILLFEKMNLQVLISTPDEHDRQMASSQGLVHFIGRGLEGLDMQSQQLATPDFEALLNINKMVVNDSWQLFLDMQTYNPYSADIRNKLIAELTRINDSCE